MPRRPSPPTTTLVKALSDSSAPQRTSGGEGTARPATSGGEGTARPATSGGARRPTLGEIAAAAGVSPATASRVLNESAPVAEAKRAAVLAAAEAHGYTPNAIARALVSRRTRTLGVLVTDNAAPTYAALLHGAEQVVHAAGWGLLLANSGDDQEQALRALSLFARQQVDGVLLAPLQTDRRDLDALRGAAIPFVLMLRHFEDELEVDAVVADNVRGGELATAHLLELGHRRIAHLGGPRHVSSAAAREAGWRAAHAAAGLVAADDLVRHAAFTMAAGHAAAGELLDAPEAPTAIYAATDVQAVGALRAARERGLRVPGDLSVAGSDDVELARYLEVGLTTVRQPAAEIGARAVELLMDRIERGDGPPRRLTLPVELVVRGSTAPPADPDLRGAT